MKLTRSHGYAHAAALVLALASCAHQDVAVEATLSPAPAPVEESEKPTSGPRSIKDVFPDYRPKLTPDTVLDYRPMTSADFSQLPDSRLANLPRLIALLEAQKKAAARDPGEWAPGNIPLGGNPKEYRPSDNELLAAEIGIRIGQVVEKADATELAATLARAGVSAPSVTFNAFEFRHVDVMGSGRFFYASGPKEVTVKLKK